MLYAPDLDTLTTIVASDLKDGDDIVNLGTVQGPPARQGVWVLVEVATTTPGLGTGRIHDTRANLILHEADTVVVVLAEED